MDKKKKEDFIDNDFKVSSITECTGILSNGYGTEEDIKNCNDLYNFIPEPVNPDEKEKD